MEKFWIVYGAKNSGQFERFKTYELAEESAKRSAFNDRTNEFVILEAVATTKQPIPAIDIVKM